jgi:hypothetical protein
MSKLIDRSKKLHKWFIGDRLTLLASWTLCVLSGSGAILSLILLVLGSANWFWVPFGLLSISFYPPFKTNLWIKVASVVVFILMT